MRREALAADRASLADAEFVLLVHDNQGEALEADVLAEQCVGADDDVDVPLRQCVQDALPFGFLLPTDQHSGSDLAAGEVRLNPSIVLCGEDFGGGHDGRLLAVRHGQKRRV